MIITSEKQFKQMAKKLVKDSLNWKDNSQAFFVYFVNEYNKALTHNCTYFLQVFKQLDENQQKSLKKWLLKNTNFDKLNIKEMKILTVDNEIFKFTVKNIPLWYITEKQEKQQKIYNNESFLTSLKRMVKTYNEVEIASEYKAILEMAKKLI